MGMFFKTVAAFLIGVGAIVGVQHLWVSSMMAHMRSQNVALPMSTSFKTSFTSIDADRLRAAMLPKFDPEVVRNGERLGVLGAQRRIDMQVRNAQSYVPVRGRVYGLHR